MDPKFPTLFLCGTLSLPFVTPFRWPVQSKSQEQLREEIPCTKTWTCLGAGLTVIGHETEKAALHGWRHRCDRPYSHAVTHHSFPSREGFDPLERPKETLIIHFVINTNPPTPSDQHEPPVTKFQALASKCANHGPAS